MGMKARVKPLTRFSHELWLQRPDGERTSYWINFEFEEIAEGVGMVHVCMEDLPGERIEIPHYLTEEHPGVSIKFPGVFDTAAMVFAMEIASTYLLSRTAYREGRLTWMGHPNLALAIPPHLAQYVHPPFFVEVIAPTSPIDQSALCQALSTYGCGDPPEWCEAFLEMLFRKGAYQKLFPTEQRARAFQAAMAGLGISSSIAPFQHAVPDLPPLPNPVLAP